MKRVSYGGTSFLTADRVADSLVLLVAAVREGHRVELLELPAIGSAGESVVVQLVVGPTSEIISMSEGAQGSDVDNAVPNAAEIVDYLLERIEDMSLDDPPTIFETMVVMSDPADWDDLDIP